MCCTRNLNLVISFCFFQNSSIAHMTLLPSINRAQIWGPVRIALSLFHAILIQHHRVSFSNIFPLSRATNHCATCNERSSGQIFHSERQENCYRDCSCFALVGSRGISPTIFVQESERIPMPYPQVALVKFLLTLIVIKYRLLRCKLADWCILV